MSEETQCPVSRAVELVDKVARTTRHFHGYSYASFDDILEAVRFAMSQNDLSLEVRDSIEMVEMELAVKGKAMEMRRVPLHRFAILLRWRGEPYGEAETLTMPADFSNPQRAQAVRSMAIKYYLRTKFLVPTGEPEEALVGASGGAVGASGSEVVVEGNPYE